MGIERENGGVAYRGVAGKGSENNRSRDPADF
jgi:hypothetical protein